MLGDFRAVQLLRFCVSWNSRKTGLEKLFKNCERRGFKISAINMRDEKSGWAH